jgi:hypothetical protein
MHNHGRYQGIENRELLISKPKLKIFTLEEDLNCSRQVYQIQRNEYKSLKEQFNSKDVECHRLRKEVEKLRKNIKIICEILFFFQFKQIIKLMVTQSNLNFHSSNFPKIDRKIEMSRIYKESFSKDSLKKVLDNLAFVAGTPNVKELDIKRKFLASFYNNVLNAM